VMQYQKCTWKALKNHDRNITNVIDRTYFSELRSKLHAAFSPIHTKGILGANVIGVGMVADSA
jgi:hypothetical protein